MHVADGMGPDERERVDQAQTHLRLEDLVNGPATQLRTRKARARDGTGHGVLAAVLVLHGNAPSGRHVDGEPSDHRPVVRSTDLVAVLLEVRLEDLVHYGARHAAEGDETCIFRRVTEAAVGSELVALRDVDFARIMERKTQSLRQDVRSREVPCDGGACGRQKSAEVG